MRPDATEGDHNQTPERAAWQAAHLSEEAQEWLERDARVYFQQSLSTPCLDVLAGSVRTRLVDLDGREFLDFHGNSAHQVGHGHPRVVEAILGALGELPFCPRRFTNRAAVEFAEALVGVCPIPGGRVLLAPGGAEAMSMALKLVRKATGRHKTVSFWGSFHGATLDTISVGGERLFREGVGPLMPGAQLVPPPGGRDCVLGCGGRCDLRCAQYLERVLEMEGDVAAVVAEPVRCTTVELPAPDYWPRVREACDRHGALLVFDEIPIGLGRTGSWFTFEQFGVVPDVLVLGKGLGGGVWPMAAMVARGDLDRHGEIALGHFTHEKSSVGCAAGLAGLRVIQEEGLVERSRRLGDAWRADLAERLAPWEVEVRGLGLLVGVELPPEMREHADAVLYAYLAGSLSFKVSDGRVLTLTPPLTVEEGDLERATETLRMGLDRVSAAR